MGYYVYIHTCNDNGKKYIGVTGRNPESRWKEGRGYKTNKHFYSAILKHGWNNFQHEVFEVDSKEEMYRKEVELISFYHSNDPEFGYNNSSGGEYSHLGCKCSEETRKKLKEANKKKWSDPEYRRKQTEGHKGKSVSEETRRKISEANKKRCSDPEYRRKISEIQKKVHADPEYRKRISETSKGRIHTEETKRRMSETAKERWSDPEVRRKRTEANKKSHSDPEVRRKMSEALKGKEKSEETRRKIAETLKGRHHPRIKIKLPDGTIRELTKNVIVSHYVNKGKKFEYVD